MFQEPEEADDNYLELGEEPHDVVGLPDVADRLDEVQHHDAEDLPVGAEQLDAAGHPGEMGHLDKCQAGRPELREADLSS